ncbi:MAG TPA: UDP-glucose 4-epimerase GalE [Chlamydiales bacterium]|nr:UDP-glucose 4-epimerase GalE [Chlamydiales bacterium]
MAILVTGGAGYIGSHACKALKHAGFTPIVYDNLSTGHRSFVKWGPLVIGDLRDLNRFRQTLQEYKPIGVLHFAASALVIESMQHPGKYYENNVYGTLNLLEAMREKVPYLVFSSTCATYGNPVFSPITEEHPQIPINPYGRSKLMVEQMIRDYPMNSVLLRYFNAAGADFDAEVGEDHNPETHIIPSIIEVAMGKRKEIVVYGTDFPTPDGSAIRDYIHVEDLANAHVSALQYLIEKNPSTYMNLGTGKGYSVLEMIREVEKVSKTTIPVRFEKKRAGEPSHLVASYKKAQEILKWEPRFSTLPEIIESAWNWHNRCCISHSC